MTARNSGSDASLQAAQIPVEYVQRPLDLVPVGLKEAALDSPTFRAAISHFGEQIDLLDHWLEGYVRHATKLAADVVALEIAISAFIAASSPPPQISEAIVDPDYTILAAQRYGEGARDFWQSILRSVKSLETVVIGPIKHFLSTDPRKFREIRRNYEATQRTFDSIVTRYVAQGKGKEPSSLREDAFQLYEARRAYLKASLDVSVAAPQLRSTIDKLLVQVFSNQLKELRIIRNAGLVDWDSSNSEMERVRGWSRELEVSERAFKQELLAARMQVEENALTANKPSREIDDYAVTTATYLGAPLTSTSTLADRSEKQGWLFVRTLVGKPTRTVWTRRWYFVQNGIFGWLLHGSRSGGVEESDKIGVLLCSIRPWLQEERRFCFEVKTKDTSIILQAETQQELLEWIAAFETIKRKALGLSSDNETTEFGTDIGSAFLVTAPAAHEFAINQGDAPAQDEVSPHLAIADANTPGTLPRASTDFNITRRNASADRDSEGARDHTSRLISKLDIHKRLPQTQPTSTQSPPSGIASLISASHHVLPIGPSLSSAQVNLSTSRRPQPTSTLAPTTLTSCPVMTGLSHTAIALSSEKGLRLSQTNGSGTPSSLMANVWGSKYWGFVSHVDDHVKEAKRHTAIREAPSASKHVSSGSMEVAMPTGTDQDTESAVSTNAAGLMHRQSQSADLGPPLGQPQLASSQKFPPNYPLALQTQQGQFRMLFPNASADDWLVMVFRATWNPNDQQEFPGRAYVTCSKMYFYSNHLGLVLTTAIDLREVDEVTAAPGRDCDYLYFHLHPSQHRHETRRLTVKVFLEPLRLLQRRLNHITHNASLERPDSLTQIISTLTSLEKVGGRRRSSDASRIEARSGLEDTDKTHKQISARHGDREGQNVGASLRIDGTLYGDLAKTGREVQRFRLPKSPILYTPQDMQTNIGRELPVSAKALFHVVFGDKSIVFQLRYAGQCAGPITQLPWSKSTQDQIFRRSFVDTHTPVLFEDLQSVDIFNDHLCYVVTSTKRSTSFPFADRFQIVTKYVVTHIGKSRSRLAICHKIVWNRRSSAGYLRRLLEKEILETLSTDAMELILVAVDQVSQLGRHSKTIMAIEIFGDIGKQGVVPSIHTDNMLTPAGKIIMRSTMAQQYVLLVRLVLEDVLTRLLSGLSWSLKTCMALSRSAITTLSVHKFLIFLLLTSALYNAWFSYREGLGWFQEQRAVAFFGRVGIRPHSVLNKAVYLKDVDGFFDSPGMSSLLDRNSASEQLQGQVQHSCRTRFQKLVLTADNQTSDVSNIGATEQRIRRSREALALYRYNLMVAVRMVNRIERGVVDNEWHRWVDDEHRKCRRIAAILQPRGEPTSSTQAQARSVMQAYCDTCSEEHERLSMQMVST